MKRQFIVTAPIEYGRKELEEAFETTSNATDMEVVTEIMKDNPDFTLWDLEDFVQHCNDEEFSADDCWMAYVTVEVPDDYNPYRSTWYNYLIRF